VDCQIQFQTSNVTVGDEISYQIVLSMSKWDQSVLTNLKEIRINFSDGGLSRVLIDNSEKSIVDSDSSDSSRTVHQSKLSSIYNFVILPCVTQNSNSQVDQIPLFFPSCTKLIIQGSFIALYHGDIGIVSIEGLVEFQSNVPPVKFNFAIKDRINKEEKKNNFPRRWLFQKLKGSKTELEWEYIPGIGELSSVRYVYVMYDNYETFKSILKNLPSKTQLKKIFLFS